MSIQRPLFAALSFSALLLTTTGGAFAQDASAAADRLKDILAKQGVTMSWTALNGDASTFTLDGTKFTMAANAKTLELGKITFQGLTADNGGYRIESISTDPYNFTEDNTTVEMTPVKMTGLKLPAASADNPWASVWMYETLTLDNVNVKSGDKTAFTMSGLTASITPIADDKPMDFTGGVNKFTADLSLMKDPSARQMAEALGYQTLNGSVQMVGSWQPKDGRFNLSKYDINFDDAGSLGMTFDLGGYTPELIKSLQQLQEKMTAAPTDGDNAASGVAMLGIMQQLTFHSTSIRWDDASLTSKLLEYAAKSQGSTADAVKDQMKTAIVPFLTAQLENPELSSVITAAVSTYLDNPKSLEILAKPDAPVPFTLVMSTGMVNPTALTKVLGVTVKANESH